MRKIYLDVKEKLREAVDQRVYYNAVGCFHKLSNNFEVAGIINKDGCFVIVDIFYF